MKEVKVVLGGYPERIITVLYNNSKALSNKLDKYDITVGRRVQLGRNVFLHPGVVINNESKLGDNVLVNSGTKIGPNCVIQSNVEVGWKSTIGSEVRIGANSEIGSSVYIGENCSIGSHCVIRSRAKIHSLAVLRNNVYIDDSVILNSRTKIIKDHRITLLGFIDMPRSYRYPMSSYRLATGKRYIQMGCFTRPLSAWKRDFWNNKDEFPNDDRRRSLDRKKAFDAMCAAIEVLDAPT